jgi:hypothetical protein
MGNWLSKEPTNTLAATVAPSDIGTYVLNVNNCNSELYQQVSDMFDQYATIWGRYSDLLMYICPEDPTPVIHCERILNELINRSVPYAGPFEHHAITVRNMHLLAGQMALLCQTPDEVQCCHAVQSHWDMLDVSTAKL